MKVFVTDGYGATDEHDVDVLNEDIAEELAQEYVDNGAYGQGPVDVHVYTTRFSREDGEVLREWWVTVSVPPEEPECVDRYTDHDWQSPHSLVGGLESNPGVWGSDHGKVRYTEVCSHCGIYRKTDHGATDHSGQPYTRIDYRDADEDSLAWIEEMEE
jgi:hypothetical protein